MTEETGREPRELATITKQIERAPNVESNYLGRQPLSKRSDHLELYLRRALKKTPERLGGQDKSEYRASGSDSGSPRDIQDEGDLSDTVSSPERRQLAPLLAHFDAAFDQDEKLASTLPFPHQSLTLGEVQLVSHRGDLRQLALRATREQWHTPNKLDFGILA